MRIKLDLHSDIYSNIIISVETNDEWPGNDNKVSPIRYSSEIFLNF